MAGTTLANLNSDTLISRSAANAKAGKERHTFLQIGDLTPAQWLG